MILELIGNTVGTLFEDELLKRLANHLKTISIASENEAIALSRFVIQFIQNDEENRLGTGRKDNPDILLNAVFNNSNSKTLVSIAIEVVKESIGIYQGFIDQDETNKHDGYEEYIKYNQIIVDDYSAILEALKAFQANSNGEG